MKRAGYDVRIGKKKNLSKFSYQKVTRRDHCEGIEMAPYSILMKTHFVISRKCETNN
jgi:hypothetical protein